MVFCFKLNTTYAVLFFIIAFLLYNAGNGRHSLWDRDETRFASASRTMASGNDWVIPYFNGEIRYDKPILIYWLQAGAMRTFGVGEFAARFPAALAGAISVSLIFLLAGWMGCSPGGSKLCALAAMLSVLLFLISKASTTDSVLLATIITGMSAYWLRLTRGFSWGRLIAFWVALALSILVKGPVGLMVIGLSIATDRTWWAWSRRTARRDNMFGRTEESPRWRPAMDLWGICIFMLITLPWGWAAWKATDGGFFKVAIMHHVVERSMQSFEGHSGPIFYYLPVILAALFPFSALLLVGLRWGWAGRANSQLRFLWSWFFLPTLIFSLVTTKLPHYCAPLLPPLILMMGLWWTENAGEDKTANKSFSVWWWRVGAMVMGLIGMAALIGLPLVIAKAKLAQLSLPVWILAIPLFLTTVTGAVYWWRRQARPAVGVWASGMALALLIICFWLMPAIEPLRPSKRIMAWLDSNAPQAIPVMAADYQEPSLVFYAGRLVEMIGKNDQMEAFAKLGKIGKSAPCALITTEKRWKKWLNWAKDNHMGLPQQVGIRYSGDYYLFQRGQWVKLVIVGNW